MKASRSIRVFCWVLLTFSGAAGLGFVQFLCAGQSELTQRLICAACQLLPLVGLMLIAAWREQAHPRDS